MKKLLSIACLIVPLATMPHMASAETIKPKEIGTKLKSLFDEIAKPEETRKAREAEQQRKQATQNQLRQLSEWVKKLQVEIGVLKQQNAELKAKNDALLVEKTKLQIQLESLKNK